MSAPTILGQAVLCYAPFIDRKRAVTATRLSVIPLRPDVALDAGQLLEVVAQIWPADGGKVSLNVVSEALLADLLRLQPPANVMVEVPSFMAGDASHLQALLALRANGNVLLLKGRPAEELPRDAMPCFTYSIVNSAEDGRLYETVSRSAEATAWGLPMVQSGVRTMMEMNACFSRGATAVMGWPIDDVVAKHQGASKSSVKVDMQTIVELIHRVDEEEPVNRLEQTLRRDPTLAFKLLRFINSPAFGLRVEIASFSHAIMILGHRRLKRWLALLLATATKDASMKPVMFAAVRRGLLLEEFARTFGDEEMRNELFICGVFSLLDRMFNQPFDELLTTLPVPEHVAQALVSGSGPHVPYLELARAVEAESSFDVRAAAEKLMLSIDEVNRALTHALAAAAQLD